AAIEGNAAFALDDRELRRAGPTYTVDTLQELHDEGAADLVLLLGADALADLDQWKEPARVRELARLAVAPRTGAPLPWSEACALDMPALEVSSSAIRARVRAGLPIRYLVPEAVEGYIRDHRLYLG